MTIFFTSDHHFGHANIIKHCNRPWNTVAEMNEGLIERWNERIKPEDTVYHLGDLSFTKPKLVSSFLEHLNGRKHLIRGNHDNKVDLYSHFFESVRDYRVLRWEGEIIVLMHFPISSWEGMHKGTWHLHGHSHGTHQRSLPLSTEHGPSLDVGVDCHNWYPLSFEEVREKLKDIKLQRSVDHHKTEEERA
jgi:calcineurin-like phosphoesterase family protein